MSKVLFKGEGAISIVESTVTEQPRKRIAHSSTKPSGPTKNGTTTSSSTKTFQASSANEVLRSVEVTEGEVLDYSPDYVRVDNNQMHHNRRKEILQKHPEIKKLQGRNMYTFACTLFCIALMTLTTYLLREQSILVNVIFALVVGATIDHAMWVLIHDYTHESVFEGALANKIGLLIADMTHVLPGGIPFRHFHRMHHGKLGDSGDFFGFAT